MAFDKILGGLWLPSTPLELPHQDSPPPTHVPTYSSIRYSTCRYMHPVQYMHRDCFRPFPTSTMFLHAWCPIHLMDDTGTRRWLASYELLLATYRPSGWLLAR
jgi:hypothetical protein